MSPGGRALALIPLAALVGPALVAVASPAAAADAAPVTSAKVDFTTASGAVAAGYAADRGAGYDATRGFGWVTPGTATPVDMALNTRARSGPTDQRLKTLVLMQGTGAASQPGTGSWELSVVNGNYAVTVAVGDNDYVDSTHRIVVEGTTAIAGFVPTTAQKFSTATVVVAVTDGRLTVAATGGSNSKISYVDVAPSSVVPGDTEGPAVSLTPSGTTDASGSYVDAVTFTVAASDPSGVTSRTLSIDGAAPVAYTAPVTIGTPGAHTAVAAATDGAGNTTTTAPVSVTVVGGVPSAGAVTAENSDGVPYNDRLVMSRIQTPEDGTGLDDNDVCCTPANRVHDRVTLRLRNSGTAPVRITGLTVPAGFSATPTGTLPADVAAGAALDVLVVFTATTGGLVEGDLVVASNSATTPSVTVQLAGFWQAVSERNNEPTLGNLVKGFGYTTRVISAGQSVNQKGALATIGEEVLSPYWFRADTTKPVTVRQLAAYHNQGSTATVRWFAKGSSSTLTTMFTHAGVDGQSVQPRLNGSATAPAGGSLSPAGTLAFGLKVDGEFSDNALNGTSADVSAGCVAPCGHHMRFFPARDRAGNLLVDTWLMGMDYAGINYDYQDNLYLITNMRPELPAANPAYRAVLPSALGTALDFEAPVAGTLVDADGQGTGFTSVQRNRLDGIRGNPNSSQPTRLDVAGGSLQVLAYGTSTLGSQIGSDNTLVNGLQNAFDASLEPFTISTRVQGPLTAFTSGATGTRQAGVHFGPDQDDNIRLNVQVRNNLPYVQLVREVDSVFAAVATAGSALPTNAQAVDLHLVGDPLTGTVRAFYRVTSAAGVLGPLVALPTSYTFPARKAGVFFDRKAKAGLYATARGATEYTASFGSFSIDRDDVSKPDGAPVARYDIGSASSFTDGAGRVWSGDTGVFSPSTAPAEGATTTPLEIDNTTDDLLFQTYRGNTNEPNQALRTMSYALPVGSSSPVRLRLHLAERFAANNGPGKRVFSVTAEGRVVAPDLDLFAAAGRTNGAVALTVPGLVVTDGTLNLVLKASVNYTALNAVEVLSESVAAPDTTPPPVPTGLTATPGTSSVALAWTAVSASDLAGYHVFRSTSTPVVTTGTPLSGAAPLTGTGFTDATAVPGTAYSYAVVSVDTAGNRSAGSAPAPATVPTGSGAPVDLKVDFSDAATAPAAGYVRDSGAAFGPKAGLPDHGWVTDGTSTPLSLTGNGRVRTTGVTTSDPRLRTFVHMQYGGSPSSGVVAVGAWELAVPNGSYQVITALGDAGPFYDSTHRVSVEGQADVGPLTPTSGNRFVTGTATVSVTDGRLTVRPTGTNTKIAYVDVLQQAVGPDATPPAPPSGLQATGRPAAVDLSWTAGTEADLAGYAVYRSTGAPVDTTGTPLSGAGLLTASAYSDTTATPGTAYTYAVVAVDTTGNRSAGSAPASGTRPEADTTPPPVPDGVTATALANAIKVDWSAVSAADLAGYEVHRATTTPVPTTGTPLSGVAPISGTTFTDSTAQPGTTYSYVVVAVDLTGNRSAASSPASAALAPVSLRIDFSDPATAPAAGYVRDSGQPFGARAGMPDMGWVREGTSTPVDLSANGRRRTSGVTTSDPRALTIMHMQYPAETGSAGNPTPGSFEVVVPTGDYTVTVGVGDPATFYNSSHTVNVEDQNAVALFVPTSASRQRTVTRTVHVSDGRLTLSPEGGTNTKIAWVDVDAFTPSPARPRLASATPANQADVPSESLSVTTALSLAGAGVASATVTGSTVRLLNAATGAVIAANVNTSGGGDTLVLTPNAPLSPSTAYRFEVTTGVQDTTGKAFQPWSSVFRTTGAVGEDGIDSVAFTQHATTATGAGFTSVVVGPDHQLYAGTLSGEIHRFPINGDGSLGAATVIDTVKTLNGGADRTVIGLAFAPGSTPTAPVLWVSDNAPYLGVNNVADWQGQLVRLSGADLQTGQVVVTGLPRSTRDHETNSVAFGPDGDLYVNQGSNTAMGAPDDAWGQRPERTLSAAVLRLDLDALPGALPVNVKTQEGGTYDPFAAGAPLTIHASGVRNAYDLVWHTNGQLYVPTNGSAANGNTPASPTTLPAACANRVDAAANGPWTGPAAPGLTPNPEDESDWVFKIAAKGYYGHPNPVRCEWVMNGGNPTSGSDPFQVGPYPTGTQPDRNYRAGDVFDIGVHASANGVVEYRSPVFGSKLQGKLLVVRYSAGQDIVVLDPSGPNGTIVSKTLRVTGLTGLSDPLDLAEDPTTGSLYVTELGTFSIRHLKPNPV